MKVALVHDWLNGMRGGEKVLEAIVKLFPDADIFTLIYEPEKVSKIINSRTVKHSWVQYLPFTKKKYRYYLPLFPSAIERFNLSGYELVISSSHCVAKGAIKDEKALHICYCHTPMRYARERYNDYFGPENFNPHVERIVRFFIQRLRKWDLSTAGRPDYYIANSKYIAGLIKKHYNRDAEVIYPPVGVNGFKARKENKGYFLIVSSLVPYKRVDLAIDAFNKLNLPLWVVGSGPQEKKLKKMAEQNIRFFGWQEQDNLTDFYSNCRALVFPGIEDFGIVPVEAQACGKPVIAFAAGGALETIKENVTGVFFREQSAEGLIQALNQFDKMTFDCDKIRQFSLGFDAEIFKDKFEAFVDKCLKEKNDA